MTPDQIERYSRQIRLPQVGEAGQQHLLDARALIIGMGGLGSPAALYLAATGIGHLTISDFERVETSNLQRQIIHGEADIGREKAASARDRIRALNPRITVAVLDYELIDQELVDAVRAADVVLDCTDNFPSRFAINRACVTTGTPLVTGAAIRFEGQVSTFAMQQPTAPCYQCIYPDESVAAATCAADGILAPVVGIIGSIQALEAVNVLLAARRGLQGRLLLFDGLAMAWQVVPIPHNPNCATCGTR